MNFTSLSQYLGGYFNNACQWEIYKTLLLPLNLHSLIII